MASSGTYSEVETPRAVGDRDDDDAIEIEPFHSSPDDATAARSQSTWSRYVPTVISVGVGSYVGVAVRVLLTEFERSLSMEQSELLELLGNTFFLANVLGSVIMGFAMRWKPVLHPHLQVVLTGITTGFCGSCTTFASWDVRVATLFVHGRWTHALLLIGIQIATAFGCYRCGYHAGEAMLQWSVRRCVPLSKPTTDTMGMKLFLEGAISKYLSVDVEVFDRSVQNRVKQVKEALIQCRDACSFLLDAVQEQDDAVNTATHSSYQWLLCGVLTTVALWILPFCGFSPYYSSRFLAICCGPFGALLRYYLSLYNARPSCQWFPKFTFIANVSASALGCVMLLIGSWAKRKSSDAYDSYLLYGDGPIAVGFVGSLSTVSTWIHELNHISLQKTSAAYKYGCISVAIAQLVSISILGTYMLLTSNKPLLW